VRSGSERRPRTRSGDSASLNTAPAAPPWDAVPVAVALLPMALAIAFVVAASSSDWRHALSVGGGWFVWIRPGVAAALTTFAFVVGAFGAAQSYSLATHLGAYWSKKITSPYIDAVLVVLSLITIVPILVVVVVVRDGEREVFRF